MLRAAFLTAVDEPAARKGGWRGPVNECMFSVLSKEKRNGYCKEEGVREEPVDCIYTRKGGLTYLTGVGALSGNEQLLLVPVLDRVTEGHLHGHHTHNG